MMNINGNGCNDGNCKGRIGTGGKGGEGEGGCWGWGRGWGDCREGCIRPLHWIWKYFPT